MGLEDEGPTKQADAIYLPGGYPELHAGSLAANCGFRAAMLAARDRGTVIYGECGGFMVLGNQLKTEDGINHSMLGFLPVDTSFAERNLNLGYRKVRTVTASPLGKKGAIFLGHEFHYASGVVEAKAQPLFQATNAVGVDMGKMGLVVGLVAGSFIHLIDCSE